MISLFDVKSLLQKFAAFTALMLVLLPALFAGTSTSVTYYPAPIGQYLIVEASQTLTIGRSATPATGVTFNGNNMLRVLEVKNNLIGAWLGTSRGGNFRVEGNVNIRDSASRSVFFVDAANNRVGVGLDSNSIRTNSGMNLDVRGSLKAQVIAARESTADPYNDTNPWGEMQAQYNAADNTSAAANPAGSYARFSTVYKDVSLNPTGYSFGTLHIDAQPIYLQSRNKSAQGVTLGQGRGRVVIRGYNDPLMTGATGTAANLIFVVGEPGSTGISLANNWNANSSSRAFKKDIAPLAHADYQAALSKLASTDIVRYRFKEEAPDEPLHTGFIAEDAPAEFSEGGKTVSLQDEMGFLLATLKALKTESDQMRRRTEELRHE